MTAMALTLLGRVGNHSLEKIADCGREMET
jgi:hypothetical protein